METTTATRPQEETRTGPATLAVRATFIGGLRDGLIVAGCAFLAGAAVVSRGLTGG